MHKTRIALAVQAALASPAKKPDKIDIPNSDGVTSDPSWARATRGGAAGS